MCHVPLMRETLDAAMKESRGYIGHIHIGNCVLKDESHPLFGDKHAPLDIERGEYGMADVARLISLGLNMGYFKSSNRGWASLEMRPYPEKSPAESLNISFRIFMQAWEKAIS